MTKQLAWMTDLHLNFVDRRAVERLARDVRDSRPDAVLIGGDIGEAPNVSSFLQLLAELLQLPIYFVLGNHDFYQGSITAVRKKIADLVSRSTGLTWLSSTGVISLTTRTALVGHDGWGDGGIGNAEGSPVILNDFHLIEELRKPSRAELLTALCGLGEETAEHFRAFLPAALKEHEHVLVLTHVPPFREAAWYQGRQSDEDWLPYFACRAAGEVLREVTAAFPNSRVTVLCGHTHGSGVCRILPNLTVLTGGAEYRRPRMQRLIEID